MSTISPPLAPQKTGHTSLTILAFAASIALLYYGRVFLITVVIAVIISFLLDPIVTAFVKMRLPRAVASFVVMCVWARCPKCHRAVVWRVLTRASVWKWMTAVVDLRQCPSCSFAGSETDSTGSGGATT